MYYSLALLLSALATNGVHGYLLAAHRHNRKPTISEHSVLSRKSYALYLTGHILGGGFFLLFAKGFYLDEHSLGWLFSLSVVTVAFEYLQAALPARGITNRPHTWAALAMWFSFILLGLLTIIFVPVMSPRTIAASLVYLGLFVSLLNAYQRREETYKQQMIMVACFYVAIGIIAL